jgi:hypothetical protein
MNPTRQNRRAVAGRPRSSGGGLRVRSLVKLLGIGCLAAVLLRGARNVVHGGQVLEQLRALISAPAGASSRGTIDTQENAGDAPPACVSACYAAFYKNVWCDGDCFDEAKTCEFYTAYVFGAGCSDAALRPACGAGAMQQLQTACAGGCAAKASDCELPAPAATATKTGADGPPACVSACYAAFFKDEWCSGNCLDEAKTCLFYTHYLFGPRCSAGALRHTCGAAELSTLSASLATCQGDFVQLASTKSSLENEAGLPATLAVTTPLPVVLPQDALAAAAAETERQQHEAAVGGAAAAKALAAAAAVRAVAALAAAVKAKEAAMAVKMTAAACLRHAEDWGEYTLSVGSANMASALRPTLQGATEAGVFIALGDFAAMGLRVPLLACGDLVLALNGEPLLAGALRGATSVAARVAKIQAALEAGQQSAMEGRGKPGWNPNIFARPVKLRLRRPGAQPPPAERACLLRTDPQGAFIDVMFSHPYGLSLRRGGAREADLVVTRVDHGAAEGMVLPGDEVLAVGGAALNKGSAADVMTKLHSDLYPAPIEVRFRRVSRINKNG